MFYAILEYSHNISRVHYKVHSKMTREEFFIISLINNFIKTKITILLTCTQKRIYSSVAKQATTSIIIYFKQFKSFDWLRAVH